jgi:DNA-binding MarR family transcriptional regulator
VQNTHMSAQHRELHRALLEIVGAINKPQRDDALMAAAGVRLDRALFPLLIRIERFGPIGVVELADGVGRDYTTISRQVAKLESLGLVTRRQSALDRRLREAVVTAKGNAMIDLIDAARERYFREMFADWNPAEVAELTRLVRKFADAWTNIAPTASADR